MELDPGEPSLAIMYSNHLDEVGQYAVADIVLCSLRVCKPIVLPHTFTECRVSGGKRRKKDLFISIFLFV